MVKFSRRDKARCSGSSYASALIDDIVPGADGRLSPNAIAQRERRAGRMHPGWMIDVHLGVPSVNYI